MHAYYQKSKNKLQREMNNYLKLVKPEPVSYTHLATSVSAISGPTQTCEI